MMKNSADEQPGVPRQREGAQKNITCTVRAADVNDAKKIFMTARNRLVDINHWADYSRPITAAFCLTDAEGRELKRTAEKGDYFKINLPAPGSNEGDGFDWVKIETIEEQGHADDNEEKIVIQVRPASAPTHAGENIAHFFDDRATSSFMVERHGTEVTAAVFGRNEIPNTATSNMADKMRNVLVGITAIAGFSNVQWKNLVKGLIETR